MRHIAVLIGVLHLTLVGCGVGAGLEHDDLKQTEQPIVFGGGDTPDEPTPTQLALTGLTISPNSVSNTGTALVTFKVSLGGATANSCAAHLSIVNQGTNAIVYSAPVTLTGSLVTRSASVTFPSWGNYAARVTVFSTTQCKGGVKSSPLRVLVPGGVLTWVTLPADVYYATHTGAGLLTAQIKQLSVSTCSRANVWIEDGAGKRWSAFDLTLTDFATPGKFTVHDFLNLAVPNFDGSPNFAALLNPPSGVYTLHVRGDSYDCHGEVTTTFMKRKAYDIVLLGTNPGHTPNTKDGLTTSVQPSDTVALDFDKYGEDGCTASVCGFAKGHPTNGIISSSAVFDLASQYEIINCTLRLADSGSDWVGGLINPKGDTPTIDFCRTADARVSTVVHGAGSWAKFALLVWVKVPVYAGY